MKMDRSFIAVCPRPKIAPDTSRHHSMRVSGRAIGQMPELFSRIPRAHPSISSLEPGPGVGPAAAGGPGRQAQRLGGLGQGQAGEVSQLHQVGRVFVRGGNFSSASSRASRSATGGAIASLASSLIQA